MVLEAAAAIDAPELVELNLACSMDRGVTLGAATRANCAAMDSADQQSDRKLVLCCDPTNGPTSKESITKVGIRWDSEESIGKHAVLISPKRGGRQRREDQHG